MRAIYKLVLCICLIFCLCVQVCASSFSLPDETITGENDGIKITKAEPFDPLGHFVYKENLLPGDTVRKTYAISNNTKYFYTLSMKSQNPTSLQKDENGDLVDDDNDLIHQIRLVLMLDGEVIYNGSADGYDPLTGKSVLFNDGFLIGTIPNSSFTRLDVEFIIPNTLDNRFIEAEARVEWVFEAVQGEEDPNAPSTGYTSPILLLLVLFLSSIVVIWIAFKRHKKMDD